MSAADYLSLLGQRFDSFNGLWAMFATVVVGLFAYLAVTPKTSSEKLVRFCLLLAFLGFSLGNLASLLEVRSQRETLCLAALSSSQIIPALIATVQDSMPISWEGVAIYHISVDVFCVLAIFILPSQLFTLQSVRTGARVAVKPRTSKFFPIPIAWDHAARSWILVESYRAEVLGRTVVVDAGFQFDLASVPRILWPMVAPFELSIAGPLVHDYLYMKGALLGTEQPSRAEADRAFLELMKLEGISTFKAWIAYLAVRIVGWIHFRRTTGSVVVGYDQ